MEIVTKDDIRKWLEHGKLQGASHVLVKRDWFDYGYYPSYHLTLESAQRSISDSFERGADKVIEVYDLNQDWEEQLDEHRCWRI